MSDKIKTIDIPVWYTVNGHMVRRDCLSIDHPEHTYNYIKNQLGVEPEDYGVYHPDIEDCSSMTSEELKTEVMKLRTYVRSLEKMLC